MVQGSAARSAAGSVVAAVPDGRAERQLPAEIAFLRAHGVPDDILAEAARIAAQGDVSADAALLSSGLLEEEAFYRALAREVGLPFRGEEEVMVHRLARFPESVRTGVVALGGIEAAPANFGLAPRGPEVVRLLASRDRLAPRFSITTPTILRKRVLLARAESIAVRAADGLARASPELSIRSGLSQAQKAALTGLLVGTAVALGLAPDETGFVLSLLLGTAFLGNTALRLAAILEHVPVAPLRPPPRMPEADLPIYSVLVALHREARVLPKLVRALAALDYPAPKLQVMLILEADDLETLGALQDLRLPGFVEVIVAPPGEPRTKPRALNVALPLARGEFVTVYDAEDVPDPGQLRLAVSVFERSEPDVVCLQARLAIDNAADGWLTRMFAIEYATLFDVTNPALARFDLPVPLGGTSNHFRTAVLTALGGWDAYNVTEDADLGIRLAAAGYRVTDLPSTTLEEAPRHLGAWLRQRTRWMKGFLQVTVTHSRHPFGNWRRLGLARLFGATAVTLGTVASACGFPFFMLLALDATVSGRIFSPASRLEAVTSALGITLFAAGVLTFTLPPVAALRRRQWWSLLPLVPLMPVYYCLVSVAAWRGLLELVLAPDRWNKTEHGLARTSRADAATAAAAAPPPPPPGGARR